MKKYKLIESHVIPLPLKDVDTDMIIPADFLKGTGTEGLGEFVFSRLKEGDPEFVFNDAAYDTAEILVAESNFGCGSSREHAVWALLDAGIRVIIAPSFSDIFYNNSSKNGLLLVKLPVEEVNKILDHADEKKTHLMVDLENQKVTHEHLGHWEFEYDPFHKHCLLNGQDQLDYLYSHMDKIDDYEEAHK
jgi:3-isopropylmalate/(R)-2-methylmalate dehydratase small subunit